jgi:hypothetical protein
LAAWALAADDGVDRAGAELVAEPLDVVAAVGPELARALAAGEQVIDERQQVALLVLVAGGQPDRQRRAGSVDDQVETAAWPAADRARDLPAPLLASTNDASTIARDHSIASAASRRCCNRSINPAHTPAFSHSSNRRQHVCPDGRPSSRGNARHGIPNRNTHKIPSKHARSSCRLRPG